MTIECYNGKINIDHIFDSELLEDRTIIDSPMGQHTIINNRTKRRFKWTPFGKGYGWRTQYRELKPITSLEICDKIIKSLIKQLGGEIDGKSKSITRKH